LHISDDSYELKSGLIQLDFEEYLTRCVEKLYKNPYLKKIREYTQLYGKLRGLERDAILDAYGNGDGEWVYKDGKRRCSVQSWINKQDGKYSGLILNVCNPGAHTPKTKESLLILPYIEIRTKNDFGIKGQGEIFDIFERGLRSANIIPPGEEEITGYTIDYELNELRKQVGRIK
jgi:hypothetical protein